MQNEIISNKNVNSLEKDYKAEIVAASLIEQGVDPDHITIGPIPAIVMKDYLETEKRYKMLESLCEIFLPAHAFTVKDFIIAPEDSAFILSDDSHTTYLGTNFFI